MTKILMDINTIRRLQNLLCSICGQIYSYENWSDEFCRQEINEAFSYNIENYYIDPYKLSREELISIGFSKWDEDGDLLLIPLWVYPFLEDGIKLTCIDDTKAIKGKDEIDLDIRCSCIAYGVEINDSNNNHRR